MDLEDLIFFIDEDDYQEEYDDYTTDELNFNEDENE